MLTFAIGFLKNKPKSLLFLFFLGSLSFCQAQVIDSIKIGSGGGFTGKTTVFKIQKKKVFKMAGFASVTVTPSSKLTCNQAKKIKNTALALLKEPLINHPDNTYKWIEIFSEGTASKFLWGDPAFPPSTTLLNNYQQILNIVQTLKFD